MERSSRFVVHSWTKPCRKLYGAVGIYTVYELETSLCLYVGQSIDLGRRVRRFFTIDKPGQLPSDKKQACFVHINGDNTWVKHFPVFLEITTIANRYHLDKFERTMIAIKKPIYNQLLNYNKPSVALQPPSFIPKAPSSRKPQ